MPAPARAVEHPPARLAPSVSHVPAASSLLHAAAGATIFHCILSSHAKLMCSTHEEMEQHLHVCPACNCCTCMPALTRWWCTYACNCAPHAWWCTCRWGPCMSPSLVAHRGPLRLGERLYMRPLPMHANVATWSTFATYVETCEYLQFTFATWVYSNGNICKIQINTFATCIWIATTTYAKSRKTHLQHASEIDETFWIDACNLYV
jgi:hypothetical protein